jgi:hypothetical protein
MDDHGEKPHEIIVARIAPPHKVARVPTQRPASGLSRRRSHFPADAACAPRSKTRRRYSRATCRGRRKSRGMAWCRRRPRPGSQQSPRALPSGCRDSAALGGTRRTWQDRDGINDLERSRTHEGQARVRFGFSQIARISFDSRQLHEIAVRFRAVSGLHLRSGRMSAQDTRAVEKARRQLGEDFAEACALWLASRCRRGGRPARLGSPRWRSMPPRPSGVIAS